MASPASTARASSATTCGGARACPRSAGARRSSGALRYGPADARRELLLPAPWSARSRVQEYGGGAWTMTGRDDLVFVEHSDQRVWRMPAGGDARAADAGRAGMRFADLTAAEDRLYAVRETHRDGAAPVRDIVIVPLDGSAAEDPAALTVGGRGVRLRRRTRRCRGRASPGCRGITRTCPGMPRRCTSAGSCPTARSPTAPSSRRTGYAGALRLRPAAGMDRTGRTHLHRRPERPVEPASAAPRRAFARGCGTRSPSRTPTPAARCGTSDCAGSCPSRTGGSSPSARTAGTSSWFSSPPERARSASRSRARCCCATCGARGCC